ncbi:MAG: SDR family oxidoreductase [Armatimonadetes bacterium]|nr:SDR family oxidoreductase [Armatimonadota bacterium]
MSERLKAVVSGASSGIGRATAIRFAAEGCDVCLQARREGLLHELLAELPPGDHLVCAGDYSDPAVCERLAALVRERWGRVDVLAGIAGVYRTVSLLDTPYEEWRAVMDLMLDGALRLTRAVVPLMPDGGRIVHCGSILGERVEVGSSAYAVSKGALNQLCRALALELAPRGIIVNCVAPGFVDTPMSVVNGVNELQTDWFRQNYVDGHHLPLRRAGRPEEIAGVIWFLSGPDVSYLTGQVITVDGGLTITF